MGHTSPFLFSVKLRDVFGMTFSAPLTNRGWPQIIFAARPCIRELSVEINQPYFFPSTLFQYLFSTIIYFILMICQIRRNHYFL